jgi:hypothetical protein
MTEEQGIALHKMSNYFWLRFSQLVAEGLDMVPPEILDEAMETMQEHASVYGSALEYFRSPCDKVFMIHKNQQDWSI